MTGFYFEAGQSDWRDFTRIQKPFPPWGVPESVKRDATSCSLLYSFTSDYQTADTGGSFHKSSVYDFFKFIYFVKLISKCLLTENSISTIACFSLLK